MTVVEHGPQIELVQLPKVKLVDVARIVSGGTPKTTVKEYWDGEILWATPKDLSGLIGVEIDTTPRKITPAGLQSCSAELLPANSVLFSSRAPIGLLAINTVPMSTNQGFKSFVPDCSRLDSRYLYRWLEFEREWLQSLGVGATFKEVSKTTMSRVELPLPPLPEQRRIAAILDKAVHLRTQRREALAHLDSLTKSIFNDMFGDPVSNDKDFDTVPLPEIGHLYSGGTPSKAQPGLWNGDVPWFSPKDIKSTHLSDSIDHIADTAILNSSLRLLPVDTIVFVVRGMILVHSFPVAMLKNEATINQDLKAIRLSMAFNPEFLLAALVGQKQHVLSLVETSAHGTKRLSAQGIEQIQILNPPLELQQTFARRVASVERLKERHHAQLAKLDALFASLQHRAFSGAL